MARAFIPLEIDAHGERNGLRLLERIVGIGTDLAAQQVFLLYGIDPLEAVPLDAFRTSTALHQHRWPQILKDVSQRREVLRRAMARRVQPRGAHQ